MYLFFHTSVLKCCWKSLQYLTSCCNFYTNLLSRCYNLKIVISKSFPIFLIEFSLIFFSIGLMIHCVICSKNPVKPSGINRLLILFSKKNAPLFTWEKTCLIIAPFFNYVRKYFSLRGILHTPWCEKLWHFYTCCIICIAWKMNFLLWRI